VAIPDTSRYATSSYDTSQTRATKPGNDFLTSA
jgi:hypothetical protein